MISRQGKKLRRSHAALGGKVAAVVVDRVVANCEAETPIEQNTTGETGGPKGPEPTRFGDWERKGRCIDF